MSVEKTKRRYRDLSWVVLNNPVKCPQRNTAERNFPATHFAFFVEDGWFCIEHRSSGKVVEVPPSQVTEGRRKTEQELEAERAAELEKQTAKAVAEASA